MRLVLNALRENELRRPLLSIHPRVAPNVLYSFLSRATRHINCNDSALTAFSQHLSWCPMHWYWFETQVTRYSICVSIEAKATVCVMLQTKICYMSCCIFCSSEVSSSMVPDMLCFQTPNCELSSRQSCESVEAGAFYVLAGVCSISVSFIYSVETHTSVWNVYFEWAYVLRLSAIVDAVKWNAWKIYFCMYSLCNSNNILYFYSLNWAANNN